ncbi:MAG TPA: exodeoxyribonuclease VII large subunit [Candidatus Saccharimonadales bacterium]|nr:exodeoxyribonuclease VII large subunit [Candidatus Saccharimonadales bacterium]
MSELELSVSEFIALLNQTLEYAYPSVVITGELANFRISKNRWVYFDLKDESAIMRCFGTIYALPGPLEDGLLVKVQGQPRMHSQYGFSLNIRSIQPSGEGSIKKAASLLEAKLAAEGLFSPERKRSLPYPPQRIGLITSVESAAYSDFIKVLGERWGDLVIELINVQVQGEPAAGQITEAIQYFNQQAQSPDVLVIIRGGGSSEDLQAFSSEPVTRAVATSRLPTLVAIGHERDYSLAELAADQRASTPSNAAELLVPDRQHVLRQLKVLYGQLDASLKQQLIMAQQSADSRREQLINSLRRTFEHYSIRLAQQRQILELLNPHEVLRRGYVIVRKNGTIVRSLHHIVAEDLVELQFNNGLAGASITSVKLEK